MSQFKISVNTMEAIKQLLKQDIADKGRQSYHPKQILRAGVPTKKALAFNRRLIRENKTNIYLDPTQIYNEATKRFIKKRIDKRSGKIKKLFFKKNIVFESKNLKRNKTIDNSIK